MNKQTYIQTCAHSEHWSAIPPKPYNNINHFGNISHAKTYQHISESIQSCHVSIYTYVCVCVWCGSLANVCGSRAWLLNPLIAHVENKTTLGSVDGITADGSVEVEGTFIDLDWLELEPPAARIAILQACKQWWSKGQLCCINTFPFVHRKDESDATEQWIIWNITCGRNKNSLQNNRIHKQHWQYNGWPKIT